MNHPYRPLFVIADEPASAPHREVRVACGVLVAVSAIQIASGAQVIAGVLGALGGLAGIAQTWRPRWKISSSSC